MAERTRTRAGRTGRTAAARTSRARGGATTRRAAAPRRNRGMVAQTGRAGSRNMYTAAREVAGMGSVSATGRTARAAQARLRRSLGEQGG